MPEKLWFGRMLEISSDMSPAPILGSVITVRKVLCIEDCRLMRRLSAKLQ